MRRQIDARDEHAVDIGEELTVNAGPADDEAAVVVLRRLQRLLGRVDDARAGDLDLLPGDDDVVAPWQRLPAGKILQRPASYEDRVAVGLLPEVAPVGLQHDGLGALFSDAPVGIYRNDRFHAQTATGIFPLNSEYW